MCGVGIFEKIIRAYIEAGRALDVENLNPLLPDSCSIQKKVRGCMPDFSSGSWVGSIGPLLQHRICMYKMQGSPPGGMLHLRLKVNRSQNLNADTSHVLATIGNCRTILQRPLLASSSHEARSRPRTACFRGLLLTKLSSDIREPFHNQETVHGTQTCRPSGYST